MANLQFSIASTPIASPNDSAEHTILQLAAPATQGVKVSSVFIGCQGTSVTDKPIIFWLLKQTDVGIGGNFVPPEVTNGLTWAPNSTALDGTFTTEPSAITNPIWRGTIQGELNGGFQVPLGKELILAPGEFLGLLAVNSSVSANVITATFFCEE